MSMRLPALLGLLVIVACDATSPAAQPAVYELEHVRRPLGYPSGDVPFADISGTDTNWIQGGQVDWDGHHIRYLISVHGAQSHAGAREAWQIVDSGSYQASSWQCNGCMPFRLMSDQHFVPEGEIRFIPDTTNPAALADVYDLAGSSSWVYTFRRH